MTWHVSTSPAYPVLQESGRHMKEVRALLAIKNVVWKFVAGTFHQVQVSNFAAIHVKIRWNSSDP